MYSRNLDLCLFVCKDVVCLGGGGGSFVKREGTTADKLDFALARAHSFEFSSMPLKILQSCLCRKLLKILR